MSKKAMTQEGAAISSESVKTINGKSIFGEGNIETNAVPSSVDMSGYESGTIVETFADGTTKTTTIEFDSDGNPTKITDGDGNVTTYTW